VSAADPLRQIVSELERAGIEHMLAGSFASTFHGDPRTSQDIDLVIECDRGALDRFVEQLDPSRFYASAEAADRAWLRRGPFNVVILESGWKVDLFLCRNRAFSREEFARRQPAEIAGVRIFVATAEDTIVAKLEWAQAADSERQLRDVVGILELRRHELDLAYVERWVRELDLAAAWERAREQAGL
jgi:hypothetical protein